ncbi:cobalt-zinc-cadmium resistance protein CzcA [Klebsiella pneumoniae]|uniref:Cobalt-zinc-cadmium resistance protein CzcA n=1 Tax=Klebsiella pneumoniae TaxID=573 RepID=A0A378B8D9_KLEPN|nr:cobalt-zinc-cadmium resistance protein CzcA [Klebsiella pneumoniae]
MIIFVLLYLAFRRVGEALLIITSVPFALVGGIWFLYWMGFHLSVATGTGFIAPGRGGGGVWRGDADVTCAMPLRPSHRWRIRRLSASISSTRRCNQGAVLRVRPKAMTVAVIIAGLLPILWGTGAVRKS